MCVRRRTLARSGDLQPKPTESGGFSLGCIFAKHGSPRWHSGAVFFLSHVCLCSVGHLSCVRDLPHGGLLPEPAGVGGKEEPLLLSALSKTVSQNFPCVNLPVSSNSFMEFWLESAKMMRQVSKKFLQEDRKKACLLSVTNVSRPHELCQHHHLLFELPVRGPFCEL